MFVVVEMLKLSLLDRIRCYTEKCNIRGNEIRSNGERGNDIQEIIPKNVDSSV